MLVQKSPDFVDTAMHTLSRRLPKVDEGFHLLLQTKYTQNFMAHSPAISNFKIS